MKSSFLLPAATAILGFSIAWFAKPVAGPSKQSPDFAPAGETAATKVTRTPSDRPPAISEKRPKELSSSDFPLADQFEKGPKTRDEAKMLRLSEALGLSIDQQGSIIALVEQVQATASDQIGVIEDLTLRGKAVEEGLMKILSPEQYGKFQELRERERDNRGELRAQRDFNNALEDIDMSPDQRAEILNRLRQKSKADLQSIPASATLFFDKSMLPVGKRELSVDGVLMLAQIGGEIPDDPMEAQKKVSDRRRSELQQILECFDGVLTPAQMGQYQATLAEQKAIYDRVQRNPAQVKQLPYAGEENPNTDLEEP